MSKIADLYKRNINGIIATLVFHILLFTILLLTKIGVKQEFKETEILIDFPEELIEKLQELKNESVENETGKYSDNQLTNVASNKAVTAKNEVFDEAYQKELDQAQRLVKDVSGQLSKEIPTINDLSMPEEIVNETDIESFKDKVYNGDSNVEYFLKDRFHKRLPIPVYLAQKGGKIKVNIVVDRSGKVVKAEPVIQSGIDEQILSYAKTAALRTKFNPSDEAPQQQSGYITYNFIPQN